MALKKAGRSFLLSPVQSRGIHQTSTSKSPLSGGLTIRPGGRSSTSGLIVTVFGCTGFVGRYVVNAFGRIGSQVVCPYRGDGMNARHLKLMGDLGQIVPIPFDMYDSVSIQRAVAKSNVVVNLIGAAQETRNYNFHDANVKTAHRLAKFAKEAGVQKFVHLSALGSKVDQESHWLATKAESEEAVKDHFPTATILRCAPIFGEEDRFINGIARLLNNFPFVPLVVGGAQQIQPVYVTDVAQAILNAVTGSVEGQIFHLGGPEVYSYAEMVDIIRRKIFRDNEFYNLSDDAVMKLGRAMELLPRGLQLFTRDTFKQMKYNSVVSPDPDVLSCKDLLVNPAHFDEFVERVLIIHKGPRGPSRYGMLGTDFKPGEIDHYKELYQTPRIGKLGALSLK